MSAFLSRRIGLLDNFLVVFRFTSGGDSLTLELVVSEVESELGHHAPLLGGGPSDPYVLKFPTRITLTL